MSMQDDDLLRDDEPLAEEDAFEGDEPDDAQDDADDGDDDAQDQQPRDEQGRFAPVAALQSLRKEKQELQRRLEALERANQPQQPTQQREYTAEEQAEMRRQSERLDTLEEVARMQYTDEVVDEAQNWFRGLQQSDPWTAQAIQNARNPYKELIRRFEQALILDEIRETGIDLTDPDAWARERLAQQQQQPRRASPQQQSQAPPPRSLASQPSSGGGAGTIRVGPGSAFDDVF